MASQALTLSISGDTMKRLRVIALTLGRTVEDLAECSVEEAALDYFRHRKDDPAKKDGAA